MKVYVTANSLQRGHCDCVEWMLWFYSRPSALEHDTASSRIARALTHNHRLAFVCTVVCAVGSFVVCSLTFAEDKFEQPNKSHREKIFWFYDIRIHSTPSRTHLLRIWFGIDWTCGPMEHALDACGVDERNANDITAYSSTQWAIFGHSFFLPEREIWILQCDWDTRSITKSITSTDLQKQTEIPRNIIYGVVAERQTEKKVDQPGQKRWTKANDDLKKKKKQTRNDLDLAFAQSKYSIRSRYSRSTLAKVEIFEERKNTCVSHDGGDASCRDGPIV